MKRTLLGAGLMIAMAAILTGCTPYALVNSTVYNDANLASYSTFRIITPEQGKLPPGMKMVTYYNIAAAIREEMVDRGFTEDPNSSLLINIGITIKQEVATEPVLTPPPMPYAGPFYHGMGPWFMYPRGFYMPPYPAPVYSGQVVTGIYRAGVLTMDMVNIDTKTPLYSASVATILDNGDTQYRDLKSIVEAVETLFSKFPVPLLPQYK